MNYLVYLVKILHLLIVLFVLFVPFTNSLYLLKLYFMFVPFMILHWKLNNDTCALTEIEKYITNKKDSKDTFIGSIMGPVYEPKSQKIEILCLILWSITLYKLNSHYNIIKKK
jgi:hypothetical protein